MALLNADIPPIYCNVRKEYLYDFKKHHGESEECVVFGLTSMAGAATLFHIMLPNGAVFFRLPISAFFQKSYDRADVPDMSVDALQLWLHAVKEKRVKHESGESDVVRYCCREKSNSDSDKWQYVMCLFWF